MSSPGDYAPEAGARVASGESTTVESGDDNGGLSELREQAAAAMRNLADRYEGESKEADALVGKLHAELKVAEERATRSAAEAERIRSEADRVGAKPEWLTESTSDGNNSDPDTSEASGPAPEAQSAPESQSASASGPSGGIASSDSATSATTPDSSVPGPGPARGFAQASTTEPGSATETATATQPEPAQATSGSAGTGGGSGDDWAPRPFESWRNQSSRFSTEITDP